MKMSVRILFVFTVFCSLQQAQGHYDPEIPASCLNSTYCEDVPNYPSDELNQLIAKLGDTWQSQVDQIVYSRTSLDEDLDDKPLCSAEKKTIYPKAVVGDDGKWYSLVNTEQGVQGFKVEVCSETDSACNAVVVVTQRGYDAKCKQAYIERVATAFEKRNNGEIRLFKQSLPIPSTCTCVAHPVDPYETTVGIGQ